jgi:hypothetical protein
VHATAQGDGVRPIKTESTPSAIAGTSSAEPVAAGRRTLDNETMTYLVIVAFVAIIGSLIVALVAMMRGGASAMEEEDNGATAPRKNPMARALAFRVGFSVLLFVVVLISYKMGWIHPTGLPVGR